MEIRQHALRSIVLKLNGSGTIDKLNDTKLYKDGYGFVKLAVYAPITQDTNAPVCTVFCTTIDTFGNTVIGTKNYPLLPVGKKVIEGLGYTLFECYMPKEFTEKVTKQNGFKMIFNYYDTEILKDSEGNVVLDGNGVPKRVRTNQLPSSEYISTVYEGGWNNEDIELQINASEAAQIGENMRNITDLLYDVYVLGSRIEEEEQRATQAETGLGERIDSETDRAKKAENDLSERIDDEVERLDGVAVTLDGKIKTEEERAKLEEGKLGGRIDGEETRAKAAEKTLDDRITERWVDYTYKNTALNNRLSDEINRSLWKDYEHEGRLNTLAGEISRIDNLGHFAGAYDTYAALPKNVSSFPQGITVNDFSEIRTDETQGGATTRYIVKAIDEGGVIEWEFSTKLSTDVTGKMDLVAGGKTNNFISITPEGNSKDSGYSGKDIDDAKDLASEAKDKADEAKEVLEHAVMSPDGSTENIIALSQADYEALALRDDKTLYVTTEDDTPNSEFEQRLLDVEIKAENNSSSVAKAIKSSNATVKEVLKLTKAEHDLIKNKDPNTLYIVPEVDEDDGLTERVTRLEQEILTLKQLIEQLQVQGGQG